MPGTETVVTEIPDCDLHKSQGESHVKAYADARVPGAGWAYVCKECFDRYRCTLGVGYGQRLVLQST